MTKRHDLQEKRPSETKNLLGKKEGRKNIYAEPGTAYTENGSNGMRVTITWKKRDQKN